MTSVYFTIHYKIKVRCENATSSTKVGNVSRQ